MDYPKFIVSDQKEVSISIQNVNFVLYVHIERSRYQLEDDLTEASVKALQRLEKVKATDPGMSTLVSSFLHLFGPVH